MTLHDFLKSENTALNNCDEHLIFTKANQSKNRSTTIYVIDTKEACCNRKPFGGMVSEDDLFESASIHGKIVNRVVFTDESSATEAFKLMSENLTLEFDGKFFTGEILLFRAYDVKITNKNNQLIAVVDTLFYEEIDSASPRMVSEHS